MTDFKMKEVMILVYREASMWVSVPQNHGSWKEAFEVEGSSYQRAIQFSG